MKSTEKKYISLDNGQEFIVGNKILNKAQMESLRKYRNDYLKNNYRTFILRIRKIAEKPMIEWLESQSSIDGYLRTIIAEDMIRNNKEPYLSKEEIMMEIAKINEETFKKNLAAFKECYPTIPDDIAEMIIKQYVPECVKNNLK